MTVTNLAKVTIHRIKVIDAHSIAGEPGNYAEWKVTFLINGIFRKVKRFDAAWFGGFRHLETDVNIDFTVIAPLINGQVVIQVFGEEIDDTTANDKLTPLQKTHRPAEEFPLGASWLMATVRNLDSEPHEPFFPYKKGTETIGGYTIYYSIEPQGETVDDDRRTYYPLIRAGSRYCAWQVHNWEAFTSTQDAWSAEGLRLTRISTHLNDATSPRFAETSSRAFMGIYQEGRGFWNFWLFDAANFRAKFDQLRKAQIRCNDIFCYREGDTVMIGGVFSDDGPDTQVFIDLSLDQLRAMNLEMNRLDWSMIALDTYHNGKEQSFVALFEERNHPTLLANNLSYGDLNAKSNELAPKGLFLDDYCIHNDDGKAVFNALFRAMPEVQDWLTEDKGFSNLESRLDYNFRRERHIANLDSWSSADPE